MKQYYIYTTWRNISETILSIWKKYLLDLAKDFQRKIENTNHDFLEGPSSKWFHSPQHKSQEAGNLLPPWQS